MSVIISIILFILKSLSIIYAIAFYLDLIQDRKWVFGWGDIPFLDELAQSFEKLEKTIPLIYWLIVILLAPIVWLYTLHPLFLIDYFFGL